MSVYMYNIYSYDVQNISIQKQPLLLSFKNKYDKPLKNKASVLEVRSNESLLFIYFF